MFVALREMRFARGRFSLIVAVVAMLTLLVGFLGGLTGGLASRNVSAVADLGPGTFVLARDGDRKATMADSVLTPEQLGRLPDGTAVGLSQGRAKTPGGPAAALSFMSLSGPAPTGHRPPPGQVVLSAAAARELGWNPGEKVAVRGVEHTATATGDDAWHSHTPVVWMNPADLPATTFTFHPADPPAAPEGTVALSRTQALLAIGSFSSEVGSLGMMLGMLFLISALVIGAFFTVWTLQRTGTVAVLKALGASNATVLKDALGQAVLVLALGVGSGGLLTWGLGALAGTVLPFTSNALTTAAPLAAIVATGMLGALLSLRPLLKADPQTALGAHR